MALPTLRLACWRSPIKKRIATHIAIRPIKKYNNANLLHGQRRPGGIRFPGCPATRAGYFNCNLFLTKEDPMRDRKSLMLMMAAFLICLSSPAVATDTFAARGSAVVPGVHMRYVSSTLYYSVKLDISNTTGIDVKCKVTVYDGQGNDVTTTVGEVYEVSTAGANIVSSVNGEFDLPALSTRFFLIQTSYAYLMDGHAVIEWTSENTTLRKAIIASKQIVAASSTSSARSEIPINGGQIF